VVDVESIDPQHTLVRRPAGAPRPAPARPALDLAWLAGANGSPVPPSTGPVWSPSAPDQRHTQPPPLNGKGELD